MSDENNIVGLPTRIARLEVDMSEWRVELVAKLEDLLTQAKEGRIAAFVAVSLKSNVFDRSLGSYNSQTTIKVHPALFARPHVVAGLCEQLRCEASLSFASED